MVRDILLRKIEECRHEESVLSIRREILEELLRELSSTDDYDDESVCDNTSLSNLGNSWQQKEKSLSSLQSFLARGEDEDA